MIEKELIKFQQELGEIKQGLLTGVPPAFPGDQEGYELATKIDITINRLLRILEHK